ncbi:MAG: PilT/PilU family type 4a pilus ATPase [Bryobacteraceae bacterium]|nr:PilT/PilU family type 4a pilus ATPase [Bryobacteraceae bacterium]
MAGYEGELEQIVAQLNRAAPGSRPQRAEVVGATASLDPLLNAAARRGASDLLLIAGAPVTLRIGGVLTPSSAQPLTGEDTRNLLLGLLNQRQQEELERNRSIDFCFSREGAGRLRANLHYQRGTLAASIRLLPARIPTLESLELPAGLAKLAERRQGLVLVTGPSGSGKSSTLAAFVDLINRTRQDHVVTIEDPVEFVHGNRGCIIEQIEIGQDAADFASSLRGILRQTPDVIVVGEMRDPATMAAALTAAETGHLVFTTLHTNDTSQAVLRILDTFPAGSQQQVRQQLSLALAAVIAQQLLPGQDGRRHPVLEIMIGTAGIRSLIRKGEDHQLYSQISTGRAEGMMTMEQSLAEAARQGRITRETAQAHCFRPEELKRYLGG